MIDLKMVDNSMMVESLLQQADNASSLVVDFQLLNNS